MRFDKLVVNIPKFFSMILLIGLMIGCQSVLDPYTGKVVNEDSRIPLAEGGPYEGVWKTSDMSFQYSYVKDSDSLKISGNLALLVASCHRFAILDSLFVRINFIDAEGKLIQSKVLWSTVSSNYSYEWKIGERGVELPPDTAAIGFSYIGRLKEAGSDPTDMDLWCSPLGK